MKFKIALITCTLFTVISGCKKLEFPDEDSKEVIGSWRYLESFHIINGESVAGLNSSNSIDFSSKGVYRLFENETQLEKSKFRFEKRKSISGAERMMIIYHTGSSRVQSFDVIGDTLRLYDEFYDGFEFTYIRK